MKKTALLTIAIILSIFSVSLADVHVNSLQKGLVLDMPMDEKSTSTGADIPRTLSALVGSPGIAGDVVTFSGALEIVQEVDYWISGNTYLISATISSYVGTGNMQLPYDGSNSLGASYAANGTYVYVYTPASNNVRMRSPDTNSGVATVNYIKDVTGSILDRTPYANNGTHSGSPQWANDRRFRDSRAIDFDGTVDYIDIGNTGRTIKSFSFWVYPDSTTEDIFDFDGGTHTIECTSGTISATGFDSPTIHVNGEVSSTIGADDWYHVLITTATGFTVSDMDVGRVAASYFDGTLDDIKAYDRELTQAEVTKLYKTYDGKIKVNSLQNGLVLDLSLDEKSTSTGTTDILSGWDFTSGWTTGVDATIDDADSYTTVSAIKGIRTVSNVVVPGNTYVITINGSITAGDIRVRDATSGTIVASGFGTHVAEWPDGTSTGLFGIANTIAATTDITTLEVYDVTGNILDRSQYANNCTHSGSPTWANDRRFRDSRAIDFDGTVDYIDIGNTGRTIKSFSFWVYPDSTTEDIFDFDGGTHTIECTSGTISATGFDSPTIYVNGGVSSTIGADDWYHVLITTATGFTASDMDVGRVAASYFDGTLDDIKAYDRELTQAEATKLYKKYGVGGFK